MPKREDETVAWEKQVKMKIKRRGLDIYKFFLNLLLFALIGLMIWSGIKLFSFSLFTPLIGSLIFLGEIIGFVFLCIEIRKNSWRKPSLFLTFLALLVVFIVLSFAGVKPMSDWIQDNWIQDKVSKLNTIVTDSELIVVDPRLSQFDLRLSGTYGSLT